MTHDELVKAAKKAINRVFSDTSVSREETINSLKDLSEEIDVLIDAAESDRGQ